MSNPLLQMMQASIGKPIASPALPFASWLGGTLLKAEAGESEVAYTVRHDMLNPSGTLHGGVHTAILDDVMGMTVAVMGLPSLYVSVNLSIDFLAAAREGDRIIARARVVRHGKTIINMEGEICSEQGKILSRATSNLANTGIEPPLNAKTAGH